MGTTQSTHSVMAPEGPLDDIIKKGTICRTPRELSDIDYYIYKKILQNVMKKWDPNRDTPWDRDWEKILREKSLRKRKYGKKMPYKPHKKGMGVKTLPFIRSEHVDL